MRIRIINIFCIKLLLTNRAFWSATISCRKSYEGLENESFIYIILLTKSNIFITSGSFREDLHVRLYRPMGSPPEQWKLDLFVDANLRLTSMGHMEEKLRWVKKDLSC